MIYFTGSKAHNIRIREMAVRQGLKLNEYGLFEAASGTLLAAGSGESLVEGVDSSAALRKHVELAGAMRPLAFVLLLAVGAIVLVDQLMRRGKPVPAWIPRWTGPAFGAATIVLAVVTTGWLVAVGHNGASATWGRTRVESGHDQGLSRSRAGD